MISDFIPILGHLDDLIITPPGLALAICLIPVEMLAEARAKVATSGLDRSVGYIGASMILFVWMVVWIAVVNLIRFHSK